MCLLKRRFLPTRNLAFLFEMVPSEERVVGSFKGHQSWGLPKKGPAFGEAESNGGSRVALFGEREGL